MRIFVSDNDNGGTTQEVNLAENTTISQYFRAYKSGKDISKYKCSVDGYGANANTVLEHGCRLTIGANKLEGATQYWRDEVAKLEKALLQAKANLRNLCRMAIGKGDSRKPGQLT